MLATVSTKFLLHRIRASSRHYNKSHNFWWGVLERFEDRAEVDTRGLSGGDPEHPQVGAGSICDPGSQEMCTRLLKEDWMSSASKALSQVSDRFQVISMGLVSEWEFTRSSYEPPRSSQRMGWSFFLACFSGSAVTTDGLLSQLSTQGSEWLGARPHQEQEAAGVDPLISKILCRAKFHYSEISWAISVSSQGQ